MQSLTDIAKSGNLLPAQLLAVLKELQGLNISVVDGAAAGTKMAIATIRPEDQIVTAIRLNDAWAAPTDDKANITIQSTKASGTVTFASAVADNTFTVNGLTYTIKAADAANGYDKVAVGADNTAMAANAAAAINAREALRDTGAQVVATSALGVVTVTAMTEGTAANAYTLAKVGAPITVSGATLTGGTTTGGIKSTTDLSTATLIVVWFDKQ